MEFIYCKWNWVDYIILKIFSVEIVLTWSAECALNSTKIKTIVPNDFNEYRNIWGIHSIYFEMMLKMHIRCNKNWTHWGMVTSSVNWVIISSGIGLPSFWPQAITQINVAVLAFGPPVINVGEISIAINQFVLKKIQLKYHLQNVAHFVRDLMCQMN